MRYLLDVNALVALGLLEHEFHQRVTSWTQVILQRDASELATCSITELGFVRILSQAPQYGLTTQQARHLLLRLKRASTLKFVFLVDDQDISQLPKWVKTAKETTDGHLSQLAKASDAVLATLDKRIPEALLIPES